MKSYNLSFPTDRTQLADNVPNVVLTRDPAELPGGATIPTALFRDPNNMRSSFCVADLRGPPPEESEIDNYKSLHFEHMREWLQK